MKNIKTVLTTEAAYSDDEAKRYLLRKTWDESKPRLAIIMLAPSEAGAIELDSTTMLVLNNAARLGYGSVSILNLFATLNDFALKESENEDTDNLNVIVQEAERADAVIYAAGVGKAKNKAFLRRQEQVLTVLHPFENKLHCLCDDSGKSRLQHPLSPAVRTWCLSPFKISELLDTPVDDTAEQKKKKGRPRKES